MMRLWLEAVAMWARQRRGGDKLMVWECSIEGGVLL
jgi:hypothetical protein